MQIHLNGNDITNREQLHDALSEALELPEWYGRSLDALYDCLTDLSVPTTIHVENWPEEDYMQRALAVLRDAAEDKDKLGGLPARALGLRRRRTSCFRCAWRTDPACAGCTTGRPESADRLRSAGPRTPDCGNPGCCPECRSTPCPA